MSSINFVNAYLLLLAIPLAALFIVPLCVVVRKENANLHNITSGVLHVLLAVILAFSLAGTQIVTVVTETEVYVVADVSYSATKNLDTLDNYITKVKSGLPRNSKLGIVCFGKDAEVITELGGRIKSVKSSGVDGSETNISEALEYTGSLFRDDVIKRIVLITDGSASDLRDGNALARTVANLKSRDIYVDAIFLDDNLADGQSEVQVSGVEYTRTTYRGRSEQASASVRSNVATNYTAALYRDGEKVAEKVDFLQIGYNFVTFDLDTAEKGVFDYKIEVTAEADGADYDNEYSFSQTVTDSVSVLIISENESDISVLESRYEDKAQIVSYLNDAQNPNTTDIPYTVDELCQYDEIVLANVDVRKIKNYTSFVTSLDSVVSVFGKSLITIGDTKIQQLGTETEDSSSVDAQAREDALRGLQSMLPVNFGKDEGESRLFTFVIDTSRSMELLYKFIIAKQAARYIVNNLLRDNDYVSIITFDSEVRMVHIPTDDKPLSECKDEVLQKITDLDARQGTVIGAGLNAAYKQIASLPYSNKQVMLISDGLEFMGGDDDPIQETRRLTTVGVVTSVLDVGRGADTSSAANTALTLLKDIASNGLGDYYFAANSLSVLEGEVFGQIADERTEDIVRANSYVRVNRRYDDVLDGIDASADNVSYISRYVYSSAKPDATVVLKVDYKTENNTLQVPLYAYKAYGKGMVATFTSGLDSQWLGKWVSEGIDEVLFDNIFETNVPSEKIDYPFMVTLQQQGKYMRVELTSAGKPDASAVASLNVTSPDGVKSEHSFVFATVSENGEQISMHYCQFEMPETGVYALTINYSSGENEYEVEYDFDLPYTSELDVFATYDASALYTMLSGNGNVLDPDSINLENDSSEVWLYTIDLTLPLLIVCAVLWIVDIAIRKLKWADIKSLFAKSGKAKVKK